MNRLVTLLLHHYGLRVRQIAPRKGGWSALAFEVESDGGTFFLKMYEKSRASTPKWTALIDQYVPVLLRLGQHKPLNGKLPVPILTADGHNKCENEEGIFLLYEHIDGDTIGPQPLTDRQIAQLADLLAELHAFGEVELGDSAARLKEDFSSPFLCALRLTLHDRLPTLPADIRDMLALHIQPLNACMDRLEASAVRMRSGRSLRYALCHTDLHHWNLMTAGGQLILIDWEGLRLAPVEADWMFIANQPYAAKFLARYRRHHPNFRPDPDILGYYRDRRSLEDIWEWIEQLLFDTQDAEERTNALNGLKDSLEELARG